jgi:ubiquinone/menaquinone biosynthesis C-methylase UbiE
MFSQPAENPLPLSIGSLDPVVLTWTLCSIPDPQKALPEMKRVLKSEVRLIGVRKSALDLKLASSRSVES